MRMVKPVRVLWTLGIAAVGLLPLTRVASADVTDLSTERSGSIVVLPKVVWNGTRDTLIRIANTSNSMVHAHCFYVNAAPINPNLPPSSTNLPQWSETDFDLWLTRQQPTHWVASEGHSGLDNMGDGDQQSGMSPGLVPPVPKGFTGELKCIQVDASDMPLRGNALKGEASLISSSGDVSEYSAIVFQGNPDMTFTEGDPNDLFLDWTPTNLGEYSSCPSTLLLNHFTQLQPDMVIEQIGSCTSVCVAGDSSILGNTCSTDSDCDIVTNQNGVCGGCPISTELTLVPCQEDFETQTPGKVGVTIVTKDEFEGHYSTSATVDCYLSVPLDQFGQVNYFRSFATPVVYTRITPNPGQGGVIGVAEEFRRETTDEGLGPVTAAAFNVHTEGNQFDAAGVTDHIIIPQP